MLTSCWSLDQLTSAEGSALTGHSSLTVDPALCSTSRRYPTNTRGAAAATHTDMRTPVQNATARLITSLARDAVIIPRRYYANSIGYSSESASSSKWHAWFASRCPGRRLSTWPTTGVSCPTALGALCAQLFRLAWCRQHSAVMATELLQPRDLACGTLFQFSCVIPTSPTDCSDDS